MHYASWAEQRYLKTPSVFDELTYVEETTEFGRAVFAKCLIEEGTLLGIYPGQRKPRAEFYEKNEFLARSLRYAYRLRDDSVLDPTDLFGYLTNQSHLRLALVNEPPCGVQVNIIPLHSRNHIWYLALSDIQQGEQLFTSYREYYERNYPTEMTASNGEITLSADKIAMLIQRAKKYPWLKEGVEAYKMEKSN